MDMHMLSYPIGSMYAIYGNIYHQYTTNVRIYTSTMDPMGMFKSQNFLNIFWIWMIWMIWIWITIWNIFKSQHHPTSISILFIRRHPGHQVAQSVWSRKDRSIYRYAPIPWGWLLEICTSKCRTCPTKINMLIYRYIHIDIIYIYVCMYIYIIYMYVYMYVYIYTYRHTYVYQFLLNIFCIWRWG